MPKWFENGIGPCNLHMALASVNRGLETGYAPLFPSLFLSLAQVLFLPFRWSLLVLISCALSSRFCCLCAIFTFQKKKHKQKSERTTEAVEEEDEHEDEDEDEERKKRPSS